MRGPVRMSSGGRPFNGIVRQHRMSVEEIDRIDMIGVDPDLGLVRLVVTDHLSWDGEHLITLQKKLNTYLRFVESGEVYASFPNAKGRSFVIEVASLHRPTQEAEHFLGHVRTAMHAAGIKFEIGPGPSGWVTDAV
jgi:hypothetical protein